MARVRITGWRLPIRKVDLARALADWCGWSLRNVSEIIAKIPDGVPIEVETDADVLATLLDELEAAGAIAEEVSDG